MSIESEDEDTTAEPEQLPPIITLDTSIFEDVALDLENKLLLILLDHVKDGDVELAVSDVVRREVRRHIEERAEEGMSATKSIFKRFRTCQSDPLCDAKAHKALWLRTREVALDRWEKFLAKPGVTVVPVTGVDMSDVVDRYFDRRPPFGAGDKKAEFPDAIALATLLGYATALGRPLFAASGDGDWRARLEGVPNVVHFERISLLLERLLVDPGLFTARVSTWIEEKTSGVIDALTEEMRGIELIVDEREGEIETAAVERVRVKDARTVLLTKESATIELLGEAHFDVSMRWVEDSQDDSYYDSDDQLVIPERIATEQQSFILNFSALVEAEVRESKPTRFLSVKLEGSGVLHLRSGANDYELS